MVNRYGNNDLEWQQMCINSVFKHFVDDDIYESSTALKYILILNYIGLTCLNSIDFGQCIR